MKNNMRSEITYIFWLGCCVLVHCCVITKNSFEPSMCLDFVFMLAVILVSHFVVVDLYRHRHADVSPVGTDIRLCNSQAMKCTSPGCGTVTDMDTETYQITVTFAKT